MPRYFPLGFLNHLTILEVDKKMLIGKLKLYTKLQKNLYPQAFNKRGFTNVNNQSIKLLRRCFID